MPIYQCFFSLLSLDESDYQTEYEEEVLDSQKDDYVNFISSQVDEDSDSVRAALAIGCAVGTRSRCQEGLLREARRGVLRKTVQQLFCAVQALKDTCCSGGQSAVVPCGANVATLCEELRASWVWSQGGSGLGHIRHEEDEGAASFSLEEKRPRGDLPAVFSCLELGAYREDGVRDALHKDRRWQVQLAVREILTACKERCHEKHSWVLQ